MVPRLRVAAFILLALVVVGTTGYHFIEGWSLLDSFYMTVITMSTVGFGEAHPLSPLGKAFTSVMIVFGVGTLAYAVTKTTEAILERGVLRRRRMQMEIRRLTDHVIVCGYGRMGITVVDQLQGRRVPCLVIEKDPAAASKFERLGILHVLGDATDDATLQYAGVERARALAAVLPHDADNLFVTLTARGLNPSVIIVSRSSAEKNDAKMIAAGANQVLNPYRNGGRLMARQLLHPNVTEFIDVISREGTDLGLEEVRIQEGSSLAGVPLRESPIRREMEVMVVGVRHHDRKLVFNPPPDLAPAPGEILVVLGRRENLLRLERLAEGHREGPARGNREGGRP